MTRTIPTEILTYLSNWHQIPEVKLFFLNHQRISSAFVNESLTRFVTSTPLPMFPPIENKTEPIGQYESKSVYRDRAVYQSALVPAITQFRHRNCRQCRIVRDRDVQTETAVYFGANQIASSWEPLSFL